MRPERLSVALRPRNGWEAIDLGVRLVQANARSAFAVSFAVILPLALVVFAVVGYGFEMPGLAALIVWWLKPFYDRVILHSLAHAVFGEHPSLRATLAQIPRLLRASHLVSGLLWRRFDPLRSVRLPVDQLEGLAGAAARARRRVITNRVGGAGVALTFCFIHFEYILWFGLIALAEGFMPEGMSIVEHLLGSLFDPEALDPTWTLWMDLSFGLIFAAISAALEPFYVAGGFALYLKRRTDLEAWDVELLFRRVANESARSVAAALLCALCLGAFLPGAPAEAADTAARREIAIREAPTKAAEVLRAPEFGHPTKRKTLSLREEPAEAAAPPAPWLKRWLDFWRGAGVWMAETLRLAGWIGIALAVLGLLWLLARQAGVWRARRLPPPPPAEIGGLDIRPESLPDDVASTALRLIESGQARDALGLLYRGALSRLAHHERIPFGPGDTEGDCLLRVTRAGSAHRSYFAQLTRCWQSVAYAHNVPSHDEAAALCADWRASFGALR
ncbi:DUF4129 domain-containing protein [Niveibacterium sp. 24ML]|uniref:DUF4129 domain-containing protein n=1 Tax=Niveibacterium sp. 24ML TaxID=2985512 RepID=UPI00226EE954|nr:DUF4129 domain-containing protein [Niveibacterium sp. 24ML]MCX9154748.1 DUF4129 domain-containing protein [Niveibacterium sp. 24ML]